MEYYPPPFFKQGPSALVRLLFFALLAIALLVSDARWATLKWVRQATATVLYPVQRVVLAPVELLGNLGDYFTTAASARRELDGLRRANVGLGQSAATASQLASENARLRELLELHQKIATPTLAAELLYEARDPFVRKVVIDRGSNAGLAGGEPVIDAAGVIGQVTRAFPLSAEVTLLTDKDQAIPVQIVRTGARAIAYGNAVGGLELRFMASHADVVVGDALVTSGLDGVYPPGLAVAKVASVERNTVDSFARIVCLPLGGVERLRHVLVLHAANASAVPAVVPASPKGNP
jgi:rod shape-determining protein MreC